MTFDQALIVLHSSHETTMVEAFSSAPSYRFARDTLLGKSYSEVQRRHFLACPADAGSSFVQCCSLQE